jgi:hypothetical protein
VVRQVNHQRVDCQGSQLAAAFHASALPPKADIVVHADHVFYGPTPASCTAANASLFDHPVGEKAPQRI